MPALAGTGETVLLAKLFNLPRPVKRLMLLTSDTALVLVSMFVAVAMTSPSQLSIQAIIALWPLFLVLPALAIGVFIIVGMHRIKLVAFELHDMRLTAVATLGLVVLAFATAATFALPIDYSLPFVFGGLFLILQLTARSAVRNLLIFRLNGGKRRVPVAIFGAGTAGVQLLAALRQAHKMRPVVFVDDNKKLQSMTISGVRVVSRKDLRKMVEAGKVTRVLVAIPSADDVTMRKLTESLTAFGCEVHSLPTLGELIGSKGLAASLRPVTPDHLLGRDKVNLETPEMARTYAGRRVLITGAGGSIGSELCRQIIACRPQRLTILDHSEFALYSIQKELTPLAEQYGFELVTRLGSVCDKVRVTNVINESEIDIVLFAAAYKHVPLVEDNEIEGVRNNVFGTLATAEAAMEADVERFILISTDKAVRPTSVMGASKRLAELAIQDLQNRSLRTHFAMVRFGNVLGSSGSVIPLFQEQIASGGPVTLTHEKVTRYFMTISEAARLVLLAGAFSEGGDVFVLDMGHPVNINALARRLIELSGLTVKDDRNPNGDIEIRKVGLRRGEKLYEELLIGDQTLPTPHTKIMRAQENRLSEIEMARVLQQLRKAINTGDQEELRRVVATSVDGFTSDSENLEHVI